MRNTDTNDIIRNTANTPSQRGEDKKSQEESYFFDETYDMTQVSESINETLFRGNDTPVAKQNSSEFSQKYPKNNENTPINQRPKKSIPFYDLSAEERSFSYADIPNFSQNIISESIRELDDYYDEEEDDAAWGTEPHGDYYFDEEDDIPLIQYADDEIDTAPAQTSSLAAMRAETAALLEKAEAEKRNKTGNTAAMANAKSLAGSTASEDDAYYFDETDELPQLDDDMFGTQGYIGDELDGDIFGTQGYVGVEFDVFDEDDEANAYGMRPEDGDPTAYGMRPEHGKATAYGMRPEHDARYNAQPDFQNLRHGLPVQRPTDHRVAPDTGSARRSQGPRRKKLFYVVTAASLAIVILAGSIFGVQYAEAKAVEQEREYYASIGSDFVTTDTAIGEEALIRIVEERRAKDAEAKAEEERIRREKEAEEERLRLEAEEKAREGSIPVTLSLTSMEKDLKIKFFEKETGNLITGIPFNVQVTDPSGNKKEYTNDDRDGIILKKELAPGAYKVRMLPFTEEQIEENRKVKEYAIVTEDQPVTVRDKVAYEKVDVSGEIKKESEVNVAKEDTAKHDTVVESKIVDTVEWVESTKTEVPDESGAASSEPTYTEVDRSKIADPYASASAVGKAFFYPSNYLPTQVLSGLPGSASERFLSMAEGRIPTQTLRLMQNSALTQNSAKAVPQIAVSRSLPQSLQAVTRIPAISLRDAVDSNETSETSNESTSAETSESKDASTSEQSQDGSQQSQEEQTSEETKQEETTQEETTSEETKKEEQKQEEQKKEEQKQEEQKKEEEKKEEKKEEKSSVTIKAEPADLVMIAGTAADIVVTIEGTDEKGFTVKSSDESIAKAGDGSRITAVKAGSCKITVAAKADTSKTAEISVTVKGEEKKEIDENALLKDKDGNQLYVLKDDGSYREAVVSDYKDTNLKFYKKTEGKKNYRYTGWQTIEGKTYYYDKNGKPVTGEQTIQGAKYSFSAEGVLATGNTTLGIDVSTWNGSIDWNAVKASGVSYAIIRVGYRGSSIGALIDDSRFRTNISGATAAGLKVGVYFYSQAVDEVEAVEEASMVLNRISGYHLSLPVFIDVESSGGRGDAVSSSQRTANILAFCKTIASSGYATGVYANTNWLTSRMNAGALTGYHIWLAQYAAAPTYSASRYDLWQYTSTGRISGISGNVDLNYSYRSY